MDSRSGGDPVARFRRGMAMDYEKWHDGTGYDLEAIDEATEGERREIEELLLAKSVEGWRDVQALAHLDTSRTRTALLAALETGDVALRTHIIRYAPQLVKEPDRTRVLVAALEETGFYGGLTQALEQVEAFHPPAVIDALWRGAESREGEVACHFAAMLMYLHGRADEPFDWKLRPFFLRFNTEDAAERRAAYAELSHLLKGPAASA